MIGRTSAAALSKFGYKAFISYSHASDGKLAPALQSALHEFAKPVFRLRALHTFRDETNLSNSPHLWSSIFDNLSKSEYFLLLCSPEAAQSPWVTKEIESWLSLRSSSSLLIVLTDGDIVWDDEGADFDWTKTTAVPHALARQFEEQPRYTDLRWARRETDLSLTNPHFKSAVADIAATLHGLPKDELIGKDVEEHRKLARIRFAALAVLTMLTLTSTTTAGVLWWLYSKRLTPSHLVGRVRSSFQKYFIEPEMVTISPGCFKMGTESADAEERPVHDVCVRTAFEIGKFEVTFTEYERFAYATGRELPDDEGYGMGSRPVINVSWYDAFAYAAWLRRRSGKRYRLPSEAEWEYASRAGTQTQRFWGDDPSIACAYANVSDRSARLAGAEVDRASGVHDCDDGFPYTAPVGSGRKPNPWGLYDVLGNVWEWVQDCYHESYEGAPTDGSSWEATPCELRVLRGGAWNYGPASIHSANRVGNRPGVRIKTLGFRLALDR